MTKVFGDFPQENLCKKKKADPIGTKPCLQIMVAWGFADGKDKGVNAKHNRKGGKKVKVH